MNIETYHSGLMKYYVTVFARALISVSIMFLLWLFAELFVEQLTIAERYIFLAIAAFVCGATFMWFACSVHYLRHVMKGGGK